MIENMFTSKFIGNVEISNRFVIPAMVLNYCTSDGYPTERYIAYHEARARGGWGLIITEDYAVDPRGKGYSHIPGFWEEGHAKAHSELTKKIHKYDSKIFAQIYHAGRQTNADITGMTPEAPSPIPCPTKKQMPEAMTIARIEEMVDKFGNAALMAQKAGFDGIELHGAHGYLIAEFLSAYSNKRCDKYGGSLYNRTRFAVEIIENVRNKTGADFPVIFRISGDEFVPGGRTIEETKAVCMILEDAGADAIHVSTGVYGSRHKVVPPYRSAHAHIADHAAEVKSVVSVPVITVGWINDPFVAESLVRSRKSDFVAMGRASLADPDIPIKSRAGEFNKIIYCIGCLQGCTEKIRKNGERGGCMLNPVTGRESEFILNAAENRKKVMIAGGGIAGMEAAIVAAKRGHLVELYEKGPCLGGQFRLAAVAPGKGEFAGFVSRQISQLEAYNVNIFLNKELTADIVRSGKANEVIIASGGALINPDIPGINGHSTVSAWDVLSGECSTGDSVIIIGGGMVGAETANHLAAHEKQVILIDILPQIAMEEETNTRVLLMKDLDDFGVKIHTKTKVLSIEGNRVKVESDGKESFIGPADTIVIAAGTAPVNTLATEIEPSGIPTVTIGDAKQIRRALEAIEEGYRTGLSI